MANAGQYAVGIGQGAAGGAATGSMFGPWGTAIGGGLGALAGGLSTLLSSSEEARQKKKALEEYERQRAEAYHKYKEGKRNQYYDEWEQRHAARTGLNQDPMYAATHHKSFDENEIMSDFNAQVGEAPTFAEEAPPNYAALAQSMMQLGGAVGGATRQDAMQQKLEELAQSRKNEFWSAQGLPWGGYSSGGGSMY